MVKAILHLFGRILINIHLIMLMGLAACWKWIDEQIDYPDLHVGLAGFGALLLIVLLQRVILSRYVTGSWNPRRLGRFYSEDRANRYYDPWEQKRLFRERF